MKHLFITILSILLTIGTVCAQKISTDAIYTNDATDEYLSDNVFDLKANTLIWISAEGNIEYDISYRRNVNPSSTIVYTITDGKKALFILDFKDNVVYVPEFDLLFMKRKKI